MGGERKVKGKSKERRERNISERVTKGDKMRPLVTVSSSLCLVSFALLSVR